MRGLFIGRFQPFHLGHLYALKWMLKRADEIIIGIGSAQISYTIRNPFTLGERIEMIWRVLRYEKLYDRCIIIGLPDTDEIHTTWVAYIKTFSPKFDIVFTNDPLSIMLLKRENISVSNIPFFNRKNFSATNIRKKMLENDAWRKYLHPEVAKYLDEINAPQRLRMIYNLEGKNK
ncbi:MAG: nicotinamide-nucleotide adenylyltransferase [Thermoprotei archaeon]|nr:MAG: nicotinamide-nucleotide adenylyltransferase [Thermoprotei archaeon]RLE72241.1 MAG: nicotinamide-nucleotide adenylyltransferase [Thermoprotei archaeon]